MTSASTTATTATRAGNGALTAMPTTERVFAGTDHAALWLSLGVGLLVMQVGAYLVPALGAQQALAEAQLHYTQTDTGLQITYDPTLRESFLAAFDGPPVDLWPLFDACAGLPLALIRGANSDLLSPATTAEMRRRRPDMITAEVPDRAHIPFLDEVESIAALHAFLKACTP